MPRLLVPLSPVVAIAQAAAAYWVGVRPVYPAARNGLWLAHGSPRWTRQRTGDRDLPADRRSGRGSAGAPASHNSPSSSCSGRPQLLRADQFLIWFFNFLSFAWGRFQQPTATSMYRAARHRWRYAMAPGRRTPTLFCHPSMGCFHHRYNAAVLMLALPPSSADNVLFNQLCYFHFMPIPPA